MSTSFSSEFFGFPLRSQKKNLVGATTAGGKPEVFASWDAGGHPSMYFLQLPISGATSTFHKQGVINGEQKIQSEEIVCLVLLFFGGWICFPVDVGDCFWILDLV